MWALIARTGGARIFALAMSMLTLTVTARVLGPVGRGTVATVLALVEFMVTASFLSLNQVSLYRLSDKQSGASIGELTGTLGCFALGLATAASLTVFLVRAFFPTLIGPVPILYLVLGVSALPFALWDQYSAALLTGIGKIDLYNRCTLTARTAATGMTLTGVVGFGWGVSGVLVGYIVGLASSGLIGAASLAGHVKREGMSLSPTWREARALLRGASRLHLNALGGMLFTSMSVLVISHSCGPAETGMYQLATQLINTMMLVPGAVTTVVFSKVAELGPRQAWPLHRRLLAQTLLLMVMTCLVLALSAPFWLRALAGPKFDGTIEIFRIMCLGIVGATLATGMAPQWIGRGYLFSAAFIQWGVGLTGLAISLSLVPKFGGIGAAVAYSSVYVLAIFGNGWMILHCQRDLASARGAEPTAPPTNADRGG